MKILHLSEPLIEASGVSTFVREIIREQRLMGHEVDHLDCFSRVEAEQLEKYDVVHVHGIWKRLYHQVAKEIVSIRHSSASLPQASLTPKLVWSTHGMTAPWSLKHKWWKKAALWYLAQLPDLKKADLIHSTSGKELEWNKAHGLTKACLVPLGTHLPVTNLSDKLVTRRTLLFVGRVYQVKAIDRLIAAFVKASTRHEGWKLRIVGPDQDGYTAILKNLTEKLQAHDNKGVGQAHNGRLEVEFVGPKYGDELMQEYENCDCLALVSHTENFGATVVDAMAHCKPVITSTGTPWKEVLGAKCGWWVDNDEESLSGAIGEMMSMSGEERRKIGERGRKLVEAKYTWQAVAMAMVKAYEGIER